MGRALPPILAGPIVRRVEPQTFWIWLAVSASHKLSLKLEILVPENDKIGAPLKRIDAKYRVECIDKQIAEHLFICLVQCDLQTPRQLPLNSIVKYKIEAPSAPKEFREALTRRMKKVSFDGHGPYFAPAYKDSGRPVELAYISCRRLFAKGRDAIAGLAAEFGGGSPLAGKMPCLLLLGGDQIYADDVDNGLLTAVSLLVPELGNGKASPPIKRTEFARKAKLTSQVTRNHLVLPEEFFSAYLLSWSTEVGSFFTGEDKSFATEVSMWERVLAHVSTYMMFDDHEVTDDWLLDSEWKRRVQETEQGSQLLDNALAAYLFFQAWGNDPAKLSAEFLDKLAAWMLAPTKKASRAPGLDSVTWTHIVPSSIKIVFLDCRTRRSPSSKWTWYVYFDADGNPYTGLALEPLLIEPSEYKKVDVGAVTSGPLVLVVNTPVFGLELAEEFQTLHKVAASLVTSSFAELLRLDPEGWDINPASWVELIAGILTPSRTKRCVILAGDVHYSFLSEGSLSSPGGRPIECLQVVASPTKNETNVLKVLKFGKAEDGVRAVWPPQNGFAYATPRLDSEERSEALIKALTKSRGSEPFLKRWRGNEIKPLVANSIARLSVSADGKTAVKLVNADAKVMLERSW